MAKKGEKKMARPDVERFDVPLRIDVTGSMRDRLEQQARRRGLSMAAFCRMVILERLETEEGSK
jgi:hypothetical protein